jgi:phosphatidylglycerophosphate synthase
MTSLAAPAPPEAAPAPGRPPEIEEWSNRRLVHPLSARLVELLIPTRISPNAVSALGTVMAAFAALSFLFLPWPASAVAGALFLLAWHVFDGADGQLARRTGRASPNGELVDGICDHLGQVAVYVAFAVMMTPSLGGWAWALAVAAGLSRMVQASAYEGCRRNYRRWVYGARWIRQTLPSLEGSARGPFDRLKVALGRVYVAVSTAVSADDAAVEAAMSRALAEGPGPAAAARDRYRARFQPLVKRASGLSANYRSLAMAVSVLVALPVLFPLYEIVVLNLGLAALRRMEARANAALAAELEG